MCVTVIIATCPLWVDIAHVQLAMVHLDNPAKPNKSIMETDRDGGIRFEETLFWHRAQGSVDRCVQCVSTGLWSCILVPSVIWVTEGESIMSNIIVGYRITNLLENLCSSIFFNNYTCHIILTTGNMFWHLVICLRHLSKIKDWLQISCFFGWSIWNCPYLTIFDLHEWQF